MFVCTNLKKSAIMEDRNSADRGQRLVPQTIHLVCFVKSSQSDTGFCPIPLYPLLSALCPLYPLPSIL